MTRYRVSWERGESLPQLLDKGSQYLLCPPIFVIKNNVVVHTSTMTQVRLNHVVICHVHRDILSKQSCQDIAKKFVRTKNDASCRVFVKI